MPAAVLAPSRAALASPFDVRERVGLALLCLSAAVIPLAAPWIPDLATRITCGVLIAAALLGLSLASAKLTNLRHIRTLVWTWFIFALVQVLNNSIPHYVATYVLGESPTSGNPLASTVSGSVVMQLLETALAIVPILVLAKPGGLDLASLYFTTRPVGRWGACVCSCFGSWTADCVSG